MLTDNHARSDNKLAKFYVLLNIPEFEINSYTDTRIAWSKPGRGMLQPATMIY